MNEIIFTDPQMKKMFDAVVKSDAACTEITYRTEHGCRMEWSDMAGPQRVAPKHSGEKVEIIGNEVRLINWQYCGGPSKGWSPINMGELTVYKAESVDCRDDVVYFVRNGVSYAITGLRKI